MDIKAILNSLSTGPLYHKNRHQNCVVLKNIVGMSLVLLRHHLESSGSKNILCFRLKVTFHKDTVRYTYLKSHPQYRGSTVTVQFPKVGGGGVDGEN